MRRRVALATMLFVVAACQPRDPGQLVTMEDPPVTGTTLVLSAEPEPVHTAGGVIEIDAPTSATAAVTEDTAPSDAGGEFPVDERELNGELRSMVTTTSTTAASDADMVFEVDVRELDGTLRASLPTTTTAPAGG